MSLAFILEASYSTVDITTLLHYVILDYGSNFIVQEGIMIVEDRS